MNLSPFAFDLVKEEFMYATGGRADYVVNIENGLFILESRRTGLKHTVNRKVKDRHMRYLADMLCSVVPRICAK
ncbi:hypothetical protein PHMEG_00036793 [Phytophthora megakarya]|uniref:Uncharacterized protein n=1 Tax=Phytophthora megakarya TaxID=4795 RepID=A0A225UL58_9STRA|nr:hypothetical protein PHMEG_00036793 [Phytophthora megakarya]